jgi:hypothetical protein
MERKPVLKGIPEQVRHEDPIRLLEVSEVISLVTGKRLGKGKPREVVEADLIEYA